MKDLGRFLYSTWSSPEASGLQSLVWRQCWEETQREEDKQRLLAYNLPVKDLVAAVQRSNNDVGGSVVEMSEKEYMVRSRGYLKGLPDLAKVPVGMGKDGTPVLLGQVATLQVAGAERRGVGEWNGEGEAVSGVVVCGSVAAAATRS